MSFEPSQPEFHAKRQSLYHEDKLLVRLRPAARPMISALAMTMRDSAGASLDGSARTSPLSVLSRAGVIRNVTPIARIAERRHVFGGRGPMTALAASLDVPAGNRSAGANVVEVQPGTDISQIQISLASDPLVEHVSLIPRRYLMVRSPAKRKTRRRPATPTATPPAASTMWNLQRIRWSQARALSGFDEGEGIKVAVLDSGVDPSHPDLADHITDYQYEYSDLPNSPSDQDIIGHGTHVSGTIAADVNTFGVNGICSAQIYVHKIFPDGREATFYDPDSDSFGYGVDPVMYLRSLRSCLDQGVQAVNLSIGGYGTPDEEEASAFQALIDADVAVVAAMGNENTGELSYPAAISGVIAVGATSVDDTRASFSNNGPHMTLCAPGEGIWSTLPTYPGNLGFRNSPNASGHPRPGAPIPRPGGTDYASWDGTSMATPHVTAAVALVKANKASVQTLDQVRTALTSTAIRVPAMHGHAFSNRYGHGRLDLLSLIQ